MTVMFCSESVKSQLLFYFYFNMSSSSSFYTVLDTIGQILKRFWLMMNHFQSCNHTYNAEAVY